MKIQINFLGSLIIKRFKLFIFYFIILFLCFPQISNAESISKNIETITVASKRFTESYILAEIVAQTLKNNSDYEIKTKLGLGNTTILFSALLQGNIDIYPEYLGTITKEILKQHDTLSLEQINKKLLPLKIQAGVLLGFQNSYALAMRKDQAIDLGITSISDLINHPGLKIGFSHEFLGRPDGWSALQKIYDLANLNAKGLDHGLSYSALEKKQVDLIDAYTTDAQLSNENIILLVDNKSFFPTYEAVLLYRIESFKDKPNALLALEGLSQKISQIEMRNMNANVEVRGLSFSSTAQLFITQEQISTSPISFMKQLFGQDFLRLSFEHSLLVFFSLFVAMIIGIPLGILTFLNPSIGNPILYISGVFQTIPSLALLAFLITIFQTIGPIPAITALSLYALLPIIENTNTGLSTVNPSLRESARALGANRWVCLIKIELPAAIPSIVSGVKIAAITATGTATIAAFVGAGGYGERIAQGLATNNTQTMLAGAIPAAIFATLLQALISLYARFLARYRA
ncbi:MAG: ABC transporter permease subunit [Betaproteobacteria bacterium]|nr:ABC transporter permease subunit [Betaproteobacteria bacterium]